MELTTIVLSMLLSLRPAYIDQNEVDRSARMAVLAYAIADVCYQATCKAPYVAQCDPIWTGTDRELAAMLVTKGWWESRFASNVHAGKCKPDECDPKMYRGVLIHTARSPWQLQRTSYAEALWDQLEGDSLEKTRNASWVAATILSEGRRRCRSDFGTLSWYGIQRCSWHPAKRRYSTYLRLMKSGRR